MYREEKLIDGILHYRNTPKGEWIPFSLATYQRKVEQLELELKRKVSEPEMQIASLYDTLDSITFSDNELVEHLSELGNRFITGETYNGLTRNEIKSLCNLTLILSTEKSRLKEFGGESDEYTLICLDHYIKLLTE